MPSETLKYQFLAHCAPQVLSFSLSVGHMGRGSACDGALTLIERVRLWLEQIWREFSGNTDASAKPPKPLRRPANRQALRTEARQERQPLPLARDFTALAFLVPKTLSIPQFLERAARLSVLGRFGIYGYGFIAKSCRLKRRKLRRRALIASICVAPLRPD